MSDKLKNTVQSVLFSLLIVSLALVCIISPDKKFSNAERRELDSFPDLSFSSVSSGRFMSEFEDYSLDQFPLRDLFRSIKAYTSKYIFRQKSNNNIYVTDGIACKTEYPLNRDSLSYASKKFRYIFDTYLKDSNCSVYLSVIPDKNAFLAKDNDQLCIDYDALYSQMIDENDFARFIKIDHLLSADDFYATDTHWKQENIIDVAAALSNAMGSNITNDFTVNTLNIPFNGVYSGQSALPLRTDTIKILKSPSLENCKIYDFQNEKEIPLYDTSKASGKDPYEMYLSGPISLITIENPDASSDKRLVIFRDSFSSSLAPILATAFRHITLVDIRYLPSQMIGRYVDFKNSDVLFLYSTSVLNNSNTLK